MTDPAARRRVVVPMLSGLAALAAYAIFELARGTPPRLSWLGLALAAGAPVACLLARRWRPGLHHLPFTTLCALGVAITMLQSWRFGPAAGSIHAWAGLGLVAWFAFLRWLDD